MAVQVGMTREGMGNECIAVCMASEKYVPWKTTFLKSMRKWPEVRHMSSTTAQHTIEVLYYKIQFTADSLVNYFLHYNQVVHFQSSSLA